MRVHLRITSVRFIAAWVARQVTDEHRAVLDWLNEETRVSFWALEFELWRIGESIPAPKLNVVCEPNVLSKPRSGGLAGPCPLPVKPSGTRHGGPREA